MNIEHMWNSVARIGLNTARLELCECMLSLQLLGSVSVVYKMEFFVNPCLATAIVSNCSVSLGRDCAGGDLHVAGLAR